jgi:Ribosomal RNA methyltransferase (FmrO)
VVSNQPAAAVVGCGVAVTEPTSDAPDRLTACLIKSLAASIATAYKIDADTAAEQIAPLIALDRPLQQALAEHSDLAAIRRLRVFKNAEKAARKHVYNYLRRYRQVDTGGAAALSALEGLAPGEAADAAQHAIRAICETHVSTAERLSSLPQLQTVLAATLGDVAGVLDVGAGVFPLLFSFRACPKLECYRAIDKDKFAMRAVRAFARWSGLAVLSALDWSIADGWDAVVPAGRTEFDLALLLKVVPVVTRQEPRLLDVLAKTPARRLLITGSKQAMAKRQTIAHREKAAIRSFVDRYGLTIRDQFETADEIGFLVTR